MVWGGRRIVFVPITEQKVWSRDWDYLTITSRTGSMCRAAAAGMTAAQAQASLNGLFFRCAGWFHAAARHRRRRGRFHRSGAHQCDAGQRDFRRCVGDYTDAADDHDGMVLLVTDGVVNVASLLLVRRGACTRFAVRYGWAQPAGDPAATHGEGCCWRGAARHRAAAGAAGAARADSRVSEGRQTAACPSCRRSTGVCWCSRWG